MKKRKPPRAVVCMLLKDVPRQLRDCFKAKCALLGVSMKEMILSFMEEKVKERKP